jgi:hypothetical protein
MAIPAWLREVRTLRPPANAIKPSQNTNPVLHSRPIL